MHDMQGEIGIVVLVSDGLATLEFDRQSACGRCGACAMSETPRKMRMTLPAEHLVPGDRVRLELHHGFFWFSIMLSFGLPLLALVVGIILGTQIPVWLGHPGDWQPLGAISGLVLAACVYAMLRKMEPRIQKRRNSQMRAVLVEPMDGE